MTDTSPYRWHSSADPVLRDSKDTIARHQKAVVDLCRALAPRPPLRSHALP